MFDSIQIYGTKPTGNCVFVACDFNYYIKFFKPLYQSIKENFNDYDSVHCHLIGGKTECEYIIENESRVDLSFSYEIIDDVQLILEKKAYDKAHWNNINDFDVKEMLIKEFVRHSIAMRLAIRIFKLNHRVYRYLVNSLPPIHYVNTSKLKTYFSIRRFMMPANYFNNVSALLVVDVDSIFPARFNFDELITRKSCAFTRAGMWSKYLAGFVFFSFESKGNSLSLSALKSILSFTINHQGIHWGVDQVALDLLSQRKLLQPLSGLSYSFKNEVNQDTVFVSFKGKSKWDVT